MGASQRLASVKRRDSRRSLGFLVGAFAKGQPLTMYGAESEEPMFGCIPKLLVLDGNRLGVVKGDFLWPSTQRIQQTVRRRPKSLRAAARLWQRLSEDPVTCDIGMPGPS